MFDQINLFNPKRGKFLWQVGTNPGGNWNSFVIPRNASWVYLLAIGGGASGAGGQTSATGVLGGGGGGGGSGAIARLVIPTIFLPKTLYFQAGNGGAAVSGATVGNAGTKSFISDKPGVTTQQDLILTSGAVAATAPANPAGASSAGGTGETVNAGTTQPWSGLGLFSAIAGQNGGAGGASNGAGVTITWGASGIFCSGGAGGGTTNTTTGKPAGGAITGAGLVPSVAAGAASGGAGNAGVNNLSLLFGGTLGPAISGQIFASTGGSGGGANQGTAGAGGAAGLASGGGGRGGGGGTGGGTGGGGGAGGPGLIVIAWW